MLTLAITDARSGSVEMQTKLFRPRDYEHRINNTDWSSITQPWLLAVFFCCFLVAFDLDEDYNNGTVFCSNNQLQEEEQWKNMQTF